MERGRPENDEKATIAASASLTYASMLAGSGFVEQGTLYTAVEYDTIWSGLVTRQDAVPGRDSTRSRHDSGNLGCRKRLMDTLEWRDSSPSVPLDLLLIPTVSRVYNVQRT